MTSDGSVENEIKHRIQSGWRNKKIPQETYEIKASVQE
jgi:hypothetical protein